ncbi:hypothetical protein B9Z55_003943 [Caenorhabditis nigoni]|uniref:Uncharacterized protein n=1 Tax=Caenorhabditis nigoni TaxID=1611254 RepID=A0A2G5VSQ2_9PELO|nr:hypothetical protein B9Z55_003943 [Caenorhabditis nigoni]
MTVLSTLFSTIYKKIDGANKQCAMEHGYPVASIPYCPKILAQGTYKRILFNAQNAPKVLLIMAPDGAELVDPKSLAFIQEQLRNAYQEQPTLMQHLEDPFPRNTIAVSFPMFNFSVESSFHEFWPVNKTEIPENAYLTYQLQSENLQLTYYNENKIQYLAGVTFFPVLNGKAKCIENDRAAFRIATGITEPYPLQDRNLWLKKIRQHIYGRYCSVAGKRILIDCEDVYVRHWDFNHITREWFKEACEECLVDSLTYKFVDPKAEPAKEKSTSSVLEQQAEARFQELVGNDPPVYFTHRETGERLPKESQPKITEIASWIMENPDYSVHCHSALFQKFLNGEPDPKKVMMVDEEVQCDDLEVHEKEEIVSLGTTLLEEHKISLINLLEDFDVIPSSSD